MAEKLGNRWRKIITIITFVALLLLVYFSREQIGTTISGLDHIGLTILLVIVLLKFLNHHAYIKLYQSLFGLLGRKLRYWPLFRVSLEINFVNNVFPTAGLTGFSYFGLRMRQFGINAGKSTLVHTLRFVGVFLSFQVLLFFGLIFLALEGQVSNFTILIASSLATLILVGTLVVAYIVGSRERITAFFTWITRVINRIIQLVRPKHPETIKVAAAQRMFFDFHKDYKIIKDKYRALGPWFFYSLLANVVEVASVYLVYMAFDNSINPGAIILAYVIANFAGLISVLPGGIGIYEGLMVAVLATAGVSPGVSIPATIMYRILTSAIQLPPGYYFYQKTINNPKWEGDSGGDDRL